jgi:DNA-binding NarL/FixJ family response regulator
MITGASYVRLWQAPPLVADDQLRILLAEDDDQLAALIETVLHGDGRFVVVGRATTGDTAVELCKERTPDIVLMDIGMPGRDGIEATQAIHGRDPGQHVVIYTGSDEYGDVARAEDAGAVGYLHKDALTSPDLADALHVLHANYVNRVPDPE